MFTNDGVKIAAIWATALVLVVLVVAVSVVAANIYALVRHATAMDVLKRCTDSVETWSSQFCANALAQLKKE